MSVAAGFLGLVQRLFGGTQVQSEEVTANSRGRSVRRADKTPIKVFQTSFPLEAEVIRGFLESHEIPATLQQEAICQAYAFTVGDLAGTSVLVPAALAPLALDLLSEQEAAMTEAAEQSEVDPFG